MSLGHGRQASFDPSCQTLAHSPAKGPRAFGWIRNSRDSTGTAPCVRPGHFWHTGPVDEYGLALPPSFGMRPVGIEPTTFRSGGGRSIP
jgi:hypothetical protein